MHVPYIVAVTEEWIVSGQ